MPTVFLVPSGSDSADDARDGDYLLRPHGDDQYEVGRVGGSPATSCTWVGSLAASLLPSLPAVDTPQEAPEQATVLAAAQGVESAEAHRGS